MKILHVALVALVFSSCVSSNYYQIYKATAEGATLNQDVIIFEDENCKVFYDLWDNGGDIGFRIFNKTKDDLIIDLNKTFFVINGITYDYYLDRTFSNSSSTGVTESGSVYFNLLFPSYRSINTVSKGRTKTNVSSNSTSFNEKTRRTILPGTSISISEYNVTYGKYLNCDLPQRPSRRNIKTLNFGKSNSPFVFSNVITYSVGGLISRIENKFFVSEVTARPELGLFKVVTKSECGTTLMRSKRVFKESPPDKFYFKY